jgi:threonine/homoserine/homoserine lactone efflux protein
LKATLFYASLFPLCVDLAALTVGGVALIVVLTVLAVGGVKLGYALAANRIAAHFASPRLQTVARRLTGGALIGAGGVLWVKG